MEMKINNLVLDIRFRYEPVYLIRNKKDGVYEFKTSDEVAAIRVYDKDNPDGLSSLLALFVQSMKTTCTFSLVSSDPDVTGKDKYEPVRSCSVVCATKDFPVNKNEGRKEAFAKTVIEYCGDDKEARLIFWNAYRVSHKNEVMIIINKIIDYVKEKHGTEWEGEIGCPVCGNALEVFIHGKHIHGKCQSDDDCLAWNYMPKKA